MTVKREYRDRSQIQVAILDALVERGEEGMTVLELRSSVNADINAIESGLAELKQDGLITVSNTDGSTLIKPGENVIPDADNPGSQSSILDIIRDKLPF